MTQLFHMPKFYFRILLLALIAGPATASVEYFVRLDGNDGADGRSPAAAFASIQRGVDALEAGDILTIAPGEYFEAVGRDSLGSGEVDTLIRAAIPGTVLLRGDVPLSGLRKVDGYRFVWEVPFEQEPQSVIERDTLRLFDAVDNLIELEFRPGTFHYDAERQILSLSTSNLMPADQHHYSVAVTDASGIFLNQPQRVIIDGIAATGFNSNRHLRWTETFSNRWGIFLRNANHSVIRNCTAFLNGGGIGMSSGADGGDNIIEGCTAYGNYSKFNVEGGNILSYQSSRDVIRNSRAFLSRAHGMRFYGGGGSGDTLFENVLSWGNESGDIWVKGISGGENPGGGVARQAIALGRFNVRTVEQSLMAEANAYNRDPLATPDSIRFLAEEALIPDDEFADPVNFDFRLQASSRFRNSGPDGGDRGPHPYAGEVFFVAPSGDDGNPGTSVAKAWRTLSHALKHCGKGDTLYLSGGDYAETIRLGPDSPDLRGRGREPVFLSAPVTVNHADGLALERLIFGSLTIKNSSNLALNNCTIVSADPVRISSTKGLRLTHALVRSTLLISDSEQIFLAGNVFSSATPTLSIDDTSAILYSDYNSYPANTECWIADDQGLTIERLRQLGFEHYSITQAVKLQLSPTGVTISNSVPFLAAGPLGTTIGNYFPWQEEQIHIAGPFLHSVTDSTVNLEWWTSLPARVELQWDSGDGWQSVHLSQLSYFSYSLHGLEPNSPVRYRLRVVEPYRNEASSQRAVADSGTWHQSSTVTAEAAHEPQVYHVARTGDDSNDGLSRASAWRTINHAADRVRPGDTVLLAGGDYRETTWLRATGDVGRPITFRAAPGERVVFDGGQRQLFSAFVAFGKQHLRFDRFYGVGLGKIGGHDGAHLPEQQGGMFIFSNSGEVVITRCWLDGRGGGYSVPFMNVFHSHDITLRNCILQEGFNGPNIYGSSNIEFRNCIFFRNFISSLSVVNSSGQAVRIIDSIITDNLPGKAGVPLLNAGRPDVLLLDNNCFFLRRPLEERPLVTLYGDVAFERAAVVYELDFDASRLDLSEEVNPRLLIDGVEALLGDTRTIAVDPGFPALAGIPRTNDDGEPVFPVDRLGRREMDFPDLFATHPELIRRGIGLQPAAFED